MESVTAVDYIWKNGELVPWAEATTHVLSHSLHYGSGVFEDVRCYHDPATGASHVFRLRDHMERLTRSCKITCIELPYTIEQLCDAAIDVVKANKLRDCRIRPIAYRGLGTMDIDPTGSPIDVVVAAWPLDSARDAAAPGDGMTVGVSSWRQRSNNALPAALKATASCLNAMLAKMEAREHGYDEAVLLNEQGLVCEGTGESVFIVRDGVLSTPPLSDGVLEGITRDTVMCLADDLGVPAIEESLTRADLYLADEMFFAGTAAELAPVRSIDGRAIGGPGEVTRALQRRFHDVTCGSIEEYLEWLVAVE